MQQNHCPGGRVLCAEILDQSNFLKGGAINGELLLKYLYRVFFDGASADRIEFDENGDVKGSYKIVNLQKDMDGQSWCRRTKHATTIQQKHSVEA